MIENQTQNLKDGFIILLIFIIYPIYLLGWWKDRKFIELLYFISSIIIQLFIFSIWYISLGYILSFFNILIFPWK